MPAGGPMAPWLETETEALRKKTTEACRAIIDAGTPVDVAVLHGEPVPLDPGHGGLRFPPISS